MAKLKPAVHEGDHQQGNPLAPVVLVEYGDYQCPHCGKAYPVVKRLQEEFGDQLKFVFRNFPLSKIHPEAFLAAMSTEAAAKQNVFWEMHDLIFENQESLSPQAMILFAGQLNLNAAQFLKDLENEELKNKIEADFMSGMRSGVNGTPSFFINGEKFEGPAVHITLKNAILTAMDQ